MPHILDCHASNPHFCCSGATRGWSPWVQLISWNNYTFFTFSTIAVNWESVISPSAPHSCASSAIRAWMHQPKQGEVAAHTKERQELGTGCQITTVQRERIWKDGPLFIILLSLPPFLLAGTEPQTIVRRQTTVSKLTKASRTVPLWELCWGHQLVSIQAVVFFCFDKGKGKKWKQEYFD